MQPLKIFLVFLSQQIRSERLEPIINQFEQQLSSPSLGTRASKCGEAPSLHARVDWTPGPEGGLEVLESGDGEICKSRKENIAEKKPKFSREHE